jgi:lysine 2,3-aminomutase
MRQQIIRMVRGANYDVYRIIKFSVDKSYARAMLLYYLDNAELATESAEGTLHPLRVSLIRDCIAAFRNFLKPRSERLADFSVIGFLWDAVRGKDVRVAPSKAFLEDLRHILMGVAAKAEIYSDKEPPLFTQLKGREAALARSDDLDRLAECALHHMKRYPSGLDTEVAHRRKENRMRIMKLFGASEQQWDNYKWHLTHVIKSEDLLGRIIQLTDEEKEGIRLARENQVPFGITPYYASLMDPEPHRTFDHAVRAQVIPPVDYVMKLVEGRKRGMCSFDFMLESDTSPVDHVVRRYPLIVILKPYNACAQVCVYCQRNWEIKDVLARYAMIPPAKLNEALEWIKNRQGIREVLITGGDPAVLSDPYLDRLLARLGEIPHIERIRIGTRLPVVLPQRITPKFASLLRKHKVPGVRDICVVTHFEHVYEITPEATAAVQNLAQRGITVYNQLVYTVETSRRFETAALRRLLSLIGVIPYYTFNTKGKEETDRYRVPIARLQQEQKEEARLLTGVVRTDSPVYNVPRLGKNDLRSWQHHSLISILPDGRRVYEFHPWEKKISLAETYITYDVPIYNYLKELERRGENPSDYESIWYYF